MGRTLPTTTDLQRQVIEEWKPFRKALPKKDRKEFDAMLQSAKINRYAMMMTLPKHPVAIQPTLMSILFQHYQQLDELRREIEGEL